MARFSPPNAEGFYLPTTDSNDSQLIYNLDLQSEEFREFLVQLRTNLQNITTYLNKKVHGEFSLSEQVSGKQYFPRNPAATNVGQSSQINRQGYFKTINFGPLPNATTISIAHNISFDTNYTLIHAYGGATNPTAGMLSYIPINFSSPVLNENIKLQIDATNVNITTAMDYSAYTLCYVVIEYLKN